MLNRIGFVGPFVFVVAAAVGCGAPPAGSEDAAMYDEGPTMNEEQTAGEQAQAEQVAPQQEAAQEQSNAESALTNGDEENTVQQNVGTGESAVRYRPGWRGRRPGWGWGRPGWGWGPRPGWRWGWGRRRWR